MTLVTLRVTQVRLRLLRAGPDPELQPDLTETGSAGKNPKGSQGACWGLFFLVNHRLPKVVLVWGQLCAGKCLITSSPSRRSPDLQSRQHPWWKESCCGWFQASQHDVAELGRDARVLVSRHGPALEHRCLRLIFKTCVNLWEGVGQGVKFPKSARKDLFS